MNNSNNSINDSNDNGGLSTGAIVGIVIGCAFLLLLIVLFGLWYRNNHWKDDKDTMQDVSSTKLDEQQYIINKDENDDGDDGNNAEDDGDDDHVNVSVVETNETFS